LITINSIKQVSILEILDVLNQMKVHISYDLQKTPCECYAIIRWCNLPKCSVIFYFSIYLLKFYHICLVNL